MTNNTWGYSHFPLDVEDFDARDEEDDDEPAGGGIPGTWLVLWFAVGLLMWMGLWRIGTWITQVY